MVSDAILRRIFYLSFVAIVFAYGLAAGRYDLFPSGMLRDAKLAATEVRDVISGRLPWYYRWSDRVNAVRVTDAKGLSPRLRLITGIASNEDTVAKVVDWHGRVVHQWRIDWDAIWSNPEHLTEEFRPRADHVEVHGVALAPNGDLIFNFDEMGMVRLGPCGQVVWKVPYRTHHLVSLADTGNIWTSGVITRQERRADRPNHVPPFDDHTIIEISPSGKILREVFVADLLVRNNLKGLLYMSSTTDGTEVHGDTLHLNDVETFPASMTPGLFVQGDVMISLRNINTIVVFDRNWRVKFLSVGAVLRQHDPDFVDGNTISVFDNNNLSTSDAGANSNHGLYSRVVRLSAVSGTVEVPFSGSKQQPFFTRIMGMHQLLPNGNTLLVEALAGRVIEVDARGNIDWEYVNTLGDGRIGMINAASALRPEFDEQFFTTSVADCHTNN